MAQAIFIKSDDVKKFTSLNGNVDSDRFIQFIKVAQDIDLQNVLGTDLFNKINDDIVAATISGVYDTLNTTYIKPYLIHAAMVQFLPFGAYTIANKGVFKHSSETSEGVTKGEVDFLVEKERDIADHYRTRLVDYLCNNSTDFPEYLSNSDEDMRPDRDTNFNGWYL